YDNALVYWKQALDLRRRIGEKNGIVLSVQNMGFLQTARGKWDDALKSFVEALEGSRAIGFKNAEAISLGNIATVSAYRGRAAAERGEAAGAAAELSNALSEAHSLGHALLTIRAAEGLARTEAARRHWAKVEELARKALAVAEETGWEAGRYRLYGLLAASLEARGDSPGAVLARRRSAEAAHRLEENVPPAMLASFRALPSVREALSRAPS